MKKKRSRAERLLQIVQSRLVRRVQEIEQEMKRDKDQQQQVEMRSLIAELHQQRKNVAAPVQHDEEKIYQARLLLAESNKQMVTRRSGKKRAAKTLFPPSVLVRIAAAKRPSTIRRKRSE